MPRSATRLRSARVAARRAGAGPAGDPYPGDSPAPHPAPARRVALRRGSASLPGRTVLRWGVSPFLAAADIASVLAAAVLVTSAVSGGAVVLLALVVALNASGGLYRSRLTLSILEDVPGLVGRGLAAGAVATSSGLLLDPRDPSYDLIATSVAFTALAVVARAMAYAVVRAVRRRRVIAHPTLILGGGVVAGQIASILLEHPEYGLLPVGLLDSDPLLAEVDRPVPLLGGHDALATTIVEFGVHDVVIAFTSLAESQMVDLVRTCDRLFCDIFFVPRLFELHSVARDMDTVWGLPLVRMRRAAYRSFSWRVKRLVDIVVSSFALVLLAPVLVACAVAVRLDGGRGVLFRQERMGLDGRPFQLLKFRSLRPADDRESATRWSVGDDLRLGRVGRVLRRTSLDELPQLWNILRGDMTLVGPRPERPYFVERFAHTYPRYTARHRVPAGLTGWAQVHGLRGDTSIEERARFDNYYIENWSLWADLKIVLRTAGALLRMTGR